MASIVTEVSGRRRVFFDLGDGRRPSVSLGHCSMKAAQDVARMVERLANHKRLCTAIEPDLVDWVRGISDEDHRKLAAVGLVAPRSTATLEGWLEQIIAEKSAELKPASVKKWRQTKGKLLATFDGRRDLRSITPDEASQWRAGLQQAGLSVASVNGFVGFAKTMFNEALRRKLLAENPFEHLAGGSVASQSERYITPEEIEKVLTACPNLRYKVVFALARHAGLRCPSETHGLTWADIDFEKGTMRVRSPKTERHAGHEVRMVPVDPRLREILLAVQGDALLQGEEGDRVCTLSVDGKALERLRAVIRKAGVEEWDKLFQAMRWSREREWALAFPQYVVSRWIGHSITVSGKHYANHVPEELYAKASAAGKSGTAKAEGANQAVRQTVRATAESSGTAGNGAPDTETKRPDSAGFPSESGPLGKRRGGDSNSR